MFCFDFVSEKNTSFLRHLFHCDALLCHLEPKPSQEHQPFHRFVVKIAASDTDACLQMMPTRFVACFAPLRFALGDRAEHCWNGDHENGARSAARDTRVPSDRQADRQAVRPPDSQQLYSAVCTAVPSDSAARAHRLPRIQVLRGVSIYSLN
jgi:hypothetical protein